MALDCPCHSGRPYAGCCEPFHRGTPAPTCAELMRSRYSAFALGLGDYLVATLAADHPDRGLAAELGRVKDVQRFQRLVILHATEDGDEGEVLFFAGIFGKGTTPARRGDRSFAELSRFVRERGAWRYASGDLVEAARLPKDLSRLDRASFLRLSREVG